MIATCPVCRRSLALADRNGRHVASEAHYPRRDEKGAMICSPPTSADRGNLTIDVGAEPGSRGRAPRRIASAATKRP